MALGCLQSFGFWVEQQKTRQGFACLDGLGKRFDCGGGMELIRGPRPNMLSNAAPRESVSTHTRIALGFTLSQQHL